MTAIGVGIATPTVDLALSFRAKEPAVTLTNGRFDGKPVDGYNGIAGKVKVRSGGSIAIKASWGSTAYDYTYSIVDLVDAVRGRGLHRQWDQPRQDPDRQAQSVVWLQPGQLGRSDGPGAADGGPQLEIAGPP